MYGAWLTEWTVRKYTGSGDALCRECEQPLKVGDIVWTKEVDKNDRAVPVPYMHCFTCHWQEFRGKPRAREMWAKDVCMSLFFFICIASKMCS